MTGILIKRGNLGSDTQIHTYKEDNVKGHMVKMAIYKPRDLGVDPSPTASEETTPDDTLILKFWPLELGEDKFLLFSHLVYGTLGHSSSKPIPFPSQIC